MYESVCDVLVVCEHHPRLLQWVHGDGLGLTAQSFQYGQGVALIGVVEQLGVLEIKTHTKASLQKSSRKTSNGVLCYPYVG